MNDSLFMLFITNKKKKNPWNTTVVLLEINRRKIRHKTKKYISFRKYISFKISSEGTVKHNWSVCSSVKYMHCDNHKIYNTVSHKADKMWPMARLNSVFGYRNTNKQYMFAGGFTKKETQT